MIKVRKMIIKNLKMLNSMIKFNNSIKKNGRIAVKEFIKAIKF
jgi:hypothetical protein